MGALPSKVISPMITAVPVGALAVATGLVPVEADGRLGTGLRLFSDLSFPLCISLRLRGSA